MRRTGRCVSDSHRIPKRANTAARQIKFGDPIESFPIGEQCLAGPRFSVHSCFQPGGKRRGTSTPSTLINQRWPRKNLPEKAARSHKLP